MKTSSGTMYQIFEQFQELFTEQKYLHYYASYVHFLKKSCARNSTGRKSHDIDKLDVIRLITHVFELCKKFLIIHKKWTHGPRARF